MNKVTISYVIYKNYYQGLKTVKGSYDAKSKTIVVLMNNLTMKDYYEDIDKMIKELEEDKKQRKEKKQQLKELENKFKDDELIELEIPYKSYKKTYEGKYKTLLNSYDKEKKTIVVLLPQSKFNEVDRKINGKLKKAYVTFRYSDGHESDKIFNYFTSHKDNSYLIKRIKEFEKEYNCTCIDNMYR